METSQIIALYDRDERKEAEDWGMRREAAPGVVRHVDIVGSESVVLWSRLDAENADEVIEREIRYFDALGQDVEWKLYAYDQPQDLHKRLLSHGFEAEDEEAVMVLDLSEAPEELLIPIPESIRRIDDPQSLKDLTRVREAVWPGRHEGLEERLARLLRSDPERVSVYVAYDGEQPVSAARIQFPEKSAFAGLWGGATLPAYRGRGLYTALLSVRVQEAMRRGWRFLTIDASPMSRPIVEKYGFLLLSYARAHVRRRGARS